METADAKISIHHTFYKICCECFPVTRNDTTTSMMGRFSGPGTFIQGGKRSTWAQYKSLVTVFHNMLIELELTVA